MKRGIPFIRILPTDRPAEPRLHGQARPLHTPLRPVIRTTRQETVPTDRQHTAERNDTARGNLSAVFFQAIPPRSDDTDFHPIVHTYRHVAEFPFSDRTLFPDKKRDLPTERNDTARGSG